MATRQESDRKDAQAIKAMPATEVPAPKSESQARSGQTSDDALRIQLEEVQRRYVEMLGRYTWALRAGAILAANPRGFLGLLVKLLPHGLWLQYAKWRLRTKGLFDIDAYARRYPDAARAKAGPLAHFLRWGIHEGRDAGPNGRAALPPGAEPALINLILKSGLFDYSWYCEQYKVDSLNERQAVIDYLNKCSIDPFRDPGPLFSTYHYRTENPDIASMNPLHHYLTNGMSEGRRAFKSELSDAFLEASRHLDLMDLGNFIDSNEICSILFWKDGNFFFADIAKYLGEFLDSRGYRTRVINNDAAVDFARDNILVVAPHEFAIHGPGRHWSAKQSERAIYINTEQWHTSWFSLALSKMLNSRKALDINAASARGLSRLGIAAGFLPILPHEGTTFRFGQEELSAQTRQLRAIKPLTYPAEFDKRPYDVLYVAALNDRRAAALARLAPLLSSYECFLHSPQLKGPVTAENPNMIPGADLAQLARNAKILLNIHQGESRYFEWHRLVLSGICQGCVVVTEPCISTGVLEPGTHYIEADLDSMESCLKWLLSTDEGRHKSHQIVKNCATFNENMISHKGHQ